MVEVDINYMEGIINDSDVIVGLYNDLETMVDQFNKDILDESGNAIYKGLALSEWQDYTAVLLDYVKLVHEDVVQLKTFLTMTRDLSIVEDETFKDNIENMSKYVLSTSD